MSLDPIYPHDLPLTVKEAQDRGFPIYGGHSYSSHRVLVTERLTGCLSRPGFASHAVAFADGADLRRLAGWLEVDGEAVIGFTPADDLDPALAEAVEEAQARLTDGGLYNVETFLALLENDFPRVKARESQTPRG